MRTLRIPAGRGRRTATGLTQLVRCAVLVATVCAGLIAAAPTANATPVDDAITALKASGTPLYNAADSGLKLRNQAAVEAKLDSSTKIAILPAGAASDGTAGVIVAALGTPVTVAVISGSKIYASSSRFCAGFAQQQAAIAAADNQNSLDGLLEDFGKAVQSGPAVNTAQCSSAAPTNGANGSDTGTSASSKSGSSGLWLVVVLVLIGAIGLGALIVYRRRRTRRDLSIARAKVMTLYSRLANEINTIEPLGNSVAGQAMSDASERFNAAGSALADADAVEKFAVARQACIEGLEAARTARLTLGLDPGPPIPALDLNAADQLSEPREVEVQGKTYQGYPQYTPGSPHFYGGGGGIPGGWYAFPFWETLMIGSLLGGGFGWGGSGDSGDHASQDAAHDAGYDAGYGSGYAAGQDQGDSSGGSTWTSGGSDWGGGGSDWGGGDSGGGDSGGGDSGGGGDGGGGGD